MVKFFVFVWYHTYYGFLKGVKSSVRDDITFLCFLRYLDCDLHAYGTATNTFICCSWVCSK